MAKAATKEAPAEAGEGSRGKKVMLIDPKTKKEVARTDVIRELWGDGTVMKRGEIRKILKEKYNHETAYQTIFAATKDKAEKAPKAGKAAKAE